ncbi:diacylglycerol/lipid kinase family protein [Oryzobacter telluris]|uniref:diacylglycerol/lipid kinase family protein n=1 Tax=Oryzobacter telluris TaxID=3149179 RepID=UPI00370D3ED5
MSDAWWTWAGAGLAVVLVGVGLWLLLSSRAEGRHATTRPTRDSFRPDAEDVPPLKRLAVILNPTKLEGDGAVEKGAITKVCVEQGWDEPLFLPTEEHDVGFGQTRRALEERVDVICAFGGDGTVRAVAQEMVGSGVPMGLLPGGTGNLLARNLELPTDDLARAVEVAISGRNRHVDVGWMTLDPYEAHLEEHVGEGASEGQRRHAFLVMAGLGLDAAIMSETSEELKARIGWTAYVPAGLKNLLVERFKARLIIDDGAPMELRARTILVGNCGKLTGGINLMPDAEPDDGTLDIVVISPRGIAAWASVIARVVAKSDRTTKTLDRFRCQKATVHVDHAQQVELDGDIIGEARHLEVEVQPRALIVRTESGRSTSAPSA